LEAEMKRTIVYAAGLAIAGAAFAQNYYDDVAAVGSQGGYPPCSATVTDRCIQLYEPGVATPRNLALNEQLGPGRTALAAAAVEPAEPYPGEPTEPYYAGNAYAERESYDASAPVGGPYQPVADPAYAADNWPAPTRSDYPPCEPHPYDDRCIQTYEEGVGPHWGWY
jgi:hypothetical protein